MTGLELEWTYKCKEKEIINVKAKVNEIQNEKKNLKAKFDSLKRQIK